jgi:hypothetical protein
MAIKNQYPTCELTHKSTTNQGVRVIGHDSVPFSKEKKKEQSDIKFQIEQGSFRKETSDPVIFEWRFESSFVPQGSAN